MYTCKWNQFRFEIVETEISCVCAFWFITRRVFWSRRSSTGFIFSTTIGVTSSWLISIQSPNWQQNDDNSIFIVFIMIEIVTHFCKKLGQARKLWKLMQQTNGWNGGHWTRLYFPCCSPPTQEFLQFVCKIICVAVSRLNVGKKSYSRIISDIPILIVFFTIILYNSILSI